VLRIDDWTFRLLRLVGPFAMRLFPGRNLHRTITLARASSSLGSGWARPSSTLPLQLAVHPATCDRLVIIYPGLNATIDGERWFTQAHPDRYRRIARMLQSRRVAAVIRTANPHSDSGRYGEQALDRLRSVIRYGLNHATAISGTGHPELCLFGFSAGAGAIAALATECQPKRMLLVAPAGDVGPDRIIAGLKNYTGELSLMVGEDDRVVGRNAACLFDELSPAASRKQVLFVPGCDHSFTSDEHNALLEKTVLRAFQDSPR
jgi:hypothetical protein